MSKKPRIVYTESIGKKGEYKIFSVKTKELLGTIKGNNIKMYWEAFDTDNKFLMSGSRKKECMDCFREMDTKRLMAKGGGLDNRILVVLDEGNGKVINDLYTQWNNIKSDKDQANWNEKVKATTFGTYGTTSIKEVLEKFEFDKSEKINSVSRQDFKNEVYYALKYAKGGGIDFEKLSSKVAKNYEGDKVAPKYQHEYGKRYSKAEAKEVGDKVAGKVYWQQQGRKMEDGGNMDNLDASISKAIYKAYGNIDDALEFKQYNTGNGISPYRLVFLAVIKGFITPEEINKDLLDSAYETSSETEEDDEIGSSDTNNYVWSMLRDAGFDMEVENGRYVRVGNKMATGGSMSGGSNGFYIVLSDGSKKEYSFNSITEIPNIYFAMGTNGIDKGTPMVHHDNVLTSVFYANGTPVEAMPQYAGKDYYDFKNKMATGGNLDFNNLEDIKKGDFLVQENKYGNQLVQVLKIRNKEIVVQNINSETILPHSWSIGDLEDTNFRVLSKSERKNVFGEPEKLNLTYPKSSGFEERKPEDILHSYLQANKLSKIKRYQVFRDGKLVYDTLDDGFLRTDYAKRNYKFEDGGNVAEDEDYYRVFRNNAGKDIAVKIVKNPIFGKFDYYVDGTLRGQFDSFAQARQEVNYENFDMYKDGGNLHSSEFYAKGGVVVTSIKDIPNFKEENEAGRITYRGLGMGKLSDDFYKVAGENGTRIKVNGKEYNITMTEFNTFSRDSSGKMRIKFAAPLRKFADGGNLHSSEFYEDGGEIVDYQKKSNIFIARYNGKKIELEATSMFDAEKKAIEQLKVPKSKRGLLSVMNKRAYEKGDFQFN